MNRYHPALVTLHWLLAVMIILGLIMGGNVLSETPNNAPQKLFYLRMHMSMGIIILALMIIRLAIRVFSEKPPHADIGSRGLNIVGRATHYVFYLIVIALAASGLATANMAGLFGSVFGGSGAELPASFDAFPPRAAHSILALVVTLLIAGHVVAFLYHQFIRKDELFARMWLGGRK